MSHCHAQIEKKFPKKDTPLLVACSDGKAYSMDALEMLDEAGYTHLVRRLSVSISYLAYLFILAIICLRPSRFALRVLQVSVSVCCRFLLAGTIGRLPPCRRHAHATPSGGNAAARPLCRQATARPAHLCATTCKAEPPHALACKRMLVAGLPFRPTYCQLHPPVHRDPRSSALTRCLIVWSSQVGLKGGYYAWFKVFDNKLGRRYYGAYVCSQTSRCCACSVLNRCQLLHLLAAGCGTHVHT